MCSKPRIATKGDFMVVDKGKPMTWTLSSVYRRIGLTGCTLDQEGLIEMGKGIHQVRGGDWDEISNVEKAISVIESGGWIVLKFMN